MKTGTKRVYQQIKKEKYGISEQDAWKYACEKTGKEQLIDNILGKPVSVWTDEELQRAVDSIHNSVYGENGKYSGRGGANPYSLIVTNDDMVVLAKNNQKPSCTDAKAYQIFGQGNIIIADGTTSTNYKIGDIILKEGGEISHAETRAVQAVKDHGGNLQDAREVCSHLSCESCDEIMHIEGGHNITGVADPGTRGQKTRPSTIMH